MNERRTLALFGWTIGGVVGLMFVLSAFSLASVERAPHAQRIAASAVSPAANQAR